MTFAGRRPGAPGAARASTSPASAPASAALRGHRRRRPADRRARRHIRSTTLVEPRAVARGDLPAPLRRSDGTAAADASRSASSPGCGAVRRRARAPRVRGRPIRTIAFALPLRRARVHPAGGTATTYPTLADRLAFAHSFGDNKAVAPLLRGTPHDLLTVGGYTAWRVGGTLAIFAAVWGLLAAVRALRAEEDSGRARARARRRRQPAHGVHRRADGGRASGSFVLWVACFAGACPRPAARRSRRPTSRSPCAR